MGVWFRAPVPPYNSSAALRPLAASARARGAGDATVPASHRRSGSPAAGAAPSDTAPAGYVAQRCATPPTAQLDAGNEATTDNHNGHSTHVPHTQPSLEQSNEISIAKRNINLTDTHAHRHARPGRKTRGQVRSTAVSTALDRTIYGTGTCMYPTRCPFTLPDGGIL